MFDFRLFNESVSLNLLVSLLMVSAEGTGLFETFSKFASSFRARYSAFYVRSLLYVYTRSFNENLFW